MNQLIHRFSHWLSRFTGSTIAFTLAIIGVLVWLITGPYFKFSNTWLVSIATITDVIIFLMIFSLQGSENRNSKSIQLKLNELITANQKARDSFVGLEEMTDEELEELDKQFQELLTNLEKPSAMHKLHKSIKQERDKRRPSLYEQAEDLLGKIIKE
jgi:low affinity Fe/Cu permease